MRPALQATPVNGPCQISVINAVVQQQLRRRSQWLQWDVQTVRLHSVIRSQTHRKSALRLPRIAPLATSANSRLLIISSNVVVSMVVVPMIKWPLLESVESPKRVLLGSQHVLMDSLVNGPSMECKYAVPRELQVGFILNPLSLTPSSLTVCADNQVNVDGVCLNKAQLGEPCIRSVCCDFE